MASTTDSLIWDAIRTRIKGIPGGNRILFSAKDSAVITDYGFAHRETIIKASAARRSATAEALPAGRTFTVGGITVNRDAQPEDTDYLVRASSSRVDRAGDSIDPNGIDCTDYYPKNPAVLGQHNSLAIPIATSSRPFVSGDSLMAIAKFTPGVSAESDSFLAAIRAKLIRGISIGFIPEKWSFSKDRPFGIDFKSVRLLEFSCVSLPCNPDCVVLGAVTGKSASKSTPAGNVLPLSNTSDREARVAEAARLRRQAYRV
jgi:hypothetical protein